MEIEERYLNVVREKDGRIKGYSNYEKSDFIIKEDIIGLDANVLVDMVDSSDFREEIKAQVFIDVLKIYTTEIALGEARHTLIRKKGYSYEKTTEGLKQIMNEFHIEKVIHDEKSDNLGDKWVDIVKKHMYIKKFDTFPNDCKILANLVNQKGVNVYFTEDRDIEKAVKLLNIKVRVKIIPETQNLNNAKIRDFFRQRRLRSYKKRKPF